MAKKAGKKMTRDELAWNRFYQTAQHVTHERVTAITSETDRGFVLTAATILDNSLAKLLAEFFNRNAQDQTADGRNAVSSTLSTMLKDRGLLGAFWAKIEFAFLLGLIGKETRLGLHEFRDIRNDCAHSETFPCLTAEHVRRVKQHIPTLFKSLKIPSGVHSSEKHLSKDRMSFSSLFIRVWVVVVTAATSYKNDGKVWVLY